MSAEDYFDGREPWDEEETEDQTITFTKKEYDTGKATLFICDRGKFWVPNGICTIEHDVVIVPEWFEIKLI